MVRTIGSRAARPAALACGAVLALGVPEPAAAQTALRKVGRGLAGMTTSFLEVPGNMVKVSDERGPEWGLTLGFAQGLGMIPVRTLIGVYEFVTAPIPAPAGFQPIIEPEFPWDYFDAAARQESRAIRSSTSARRPGIE